MNSKQRYGVGLLIVAVAAIASVLAAPELPKQVAVHWNLAGNPDGYMPRWAALAFLPALGLVLLFAFAFVPGIDPLGGNFRQFRVAYDWFAVLTVALLAYLHGVLLLYNVGVEFAIGQAIAPAVAVIYVAVGFVLDRAERNWFVGIRTPWTLSDEQVWEQTHRRAGPLFKLAGVLALGAVVLPEYAIVFLVGPVLAIAVYTTAYSYVAYQRRDHA